MRRWICPHCSTGVVAPERMHKLDARRFCFPCSKESGRLVARHCPAAERVKTTRKERAAARRQSKWEKAKSETRERETVAGVHVPALLDELRRELVKLGYRRLLARPRLIIRRSPRIGYYTGHAWTGRHRITMTLGAIDRAAVCEIVAHELCHLAVPPHCGHNDTFNRALRELALSRWGVEIFIDEDGGGYGPSRKLTKLLREKFSAESALDERGDDGQDGPSEVAKSTSAKGETS